MKEIIVPMRNFLPLEDPQWFDENAIEEIVTLLQLNGPLPLVPVISYKDKFLLTDGHSRTIKQAILGAKTQLIRLIENEKDSRLYGTGALFNSFTVQEIRKNYAKVYSTELYKEGIFSIYDYPVMKHRSKILKLAGIRQ